MEGSASKAQTTNPVLTPSRKCDAKLKIQTRYTTATAVQHSIAGNVQDFDGSVRRTDRLYSRVQLFSRTITFLRQGITDTDSEDRRKHLQSLHVCSLEDSWL